MRIFEKSLKKATEEEKLLQKVHKGDKAAQELLYRQHVRYLAALSSRYVTNDDDAKDVLQESFIKIFSSINTFEYRGEGSLRAWMARITLNEALAFIRKNCNAALVDIADYDDKLADDEIETEGIPTDVIYRFIRELPDGYRAVFNLYVIEDKSHKEIAELLGIKVNTSASQLHKAKAILAKKINQYKTINTI